jgi:putative ABC transport system permease protein
MLEQEMIRAASEQSTAIFSEGLAFDLEIFDPGPMSIEEMLEAYDVTLDPQTSLAFFGLGLFAISISTIIPVLYIMRLNPKEILL